MKFFKCLTALLVAAFAFAPFQGYAETIHHGSDIKKDSPFAQFLDRDLVHQLGIYVQALDPLLGIESSEDFMVDAGSIVIFKSIEIQPGDKYPSSGFWAHRFEVTVDRQTRTYNLGFIAQKNAHPKPVFLSMGNTQASPILEYDALKSALMLANLEKKWSYEFNDLFKKVIVSDVKVVKPAHKIKHDGKEYESAWYEEWTFRAGKDEVVIDVLFVPNPKGGTDFYCSLHK